MVSAIQAFRWCDVNRLEKVDSPSYHPNQLMSTAIPGLDAANHLQGAKLDGDWVVLDKIEKPLDGTGGHFSVCYHVEHKSGKRAFLKALNLGKALNMPGDTLRQIEGLVQTFNFERDMVRLP
jgi:hypothetical protein